MRGNGIGRERPTDLPDVVVWQRSRATETPEDSAERFLDLAAFADDRLDPDERERVAELIANDPALAGDIGAARAIGETGEAPESVVARACALVPASDVVPFSARRRMLAWRREVASWGGLVAAMIVAGWLGFTLGMDTSLSLARNGQAGDEGFLQQMLDPSPGFMRDPSEGAQT